MPLPDGRGPAAAASPRTALPPQGLKQKRSLRDRAAGSVSRERFRFETARVPLMRQSGPRGVDTGENRFFRRYPEVEICRFQQDSAPGAVSTARTIAFSQECAPASEVGRPAAPGDQRMSITRLDLLKVRGRPAYSVTFTSMRARIVLCSRRARASAKAASPPEVRFWARSTVSVR